MMTIPLSTATDAAIDLLKRNGYRCGRVDGYG
jgi:hypothetical protein